MSINSAMGKFFDKKIQQGVGGARGQITLPRTQEDAIRNKELFISRLEELGVNLEEIKPILEDKGNQLVVSGAGAGKTTVINLTLLYDIVTGANLKVVTHTDDLGQTHQTIVPKRILVSTFLNTGAKEIKESFHEWARKIGIQGASTDNIAFKTIHGEVRGALESMGVTTPILESTDSILKRLMGELGIRNVQSRGRTPTIDEVRDVSGIVSYARNKLDHTKYNHQMMGDYKLNSLMLDLLLTKFKEERKLTYAYDYEDLQETLLEGMTMNPAVSTFINNRYDMIIVDEFQDTSQLQYEILKVYFAGKQVICVGDDDQTIYSWRGSDIDIILTKYLQDFSPNVHNLTYNYRCRSNILNALIPSIELNKKRHKKILRSANEGGEIKIIRDASVTTLVDLIESDIKQEKTVGVVARVNADLLKPAILMELDGKYDYSLSKGVSLTSKLPKQIIGLMELLCKRYSDSHKMHFETLLPRQAHNEAIRMKQTLSVNPDISILNMNMDDLKQSFPMLYPIINNIRVILDKGTQKDAYIYLLNYLHNEMFLGKSTYAKNARSFIDFMIDIVQSHPKLQEMSLEAVFHLFSTKLPVQMATRQAYTGKSIIKLTTIHEAKGKEWDTVIMWNVVEGMFPAEQPNHVLTDEEIEEERRVFYIGGTRGKTKLVIFTESGQESMFLSECNFTSLGEPEVDTGEKVVFTTQEAEITNKPTTESIIIDFITTMKETYDAGEPVNVNIQLTLKTNTIENLTAIVDSKLDLSELSEEDAKSTLTQLFEFTAKQAYGLQN